MGLISRAREATQVLISPRDVIAATVRPQDTQRSSFLTRDMVDIDRANQYIRWPKIATDLTAQQVASRPLRVFRAKPRLSGKGVWDVRKVSRRDRVRMKNGHPCIFQKFADLNEDMEEITDENHPLVKVLTTMTPWSNHYDQVEMLDSHL